jgi:ATPase subunit of ABC transporter with duplicated ATPase domains
VEKFYGGRLVLRGLEMKVNAGARIGLVGTNGAGKSTVLRILASTEEVDGGRLSAVGALTSRFCPSTSRATNARRWR